MPHNTNGSTSSSGSSSSNSKHQYLSAQNAGRIDAWNKSVNKEHSASRNQGSRVDANTQAYLDHKRAMLAKKQ